MMDNSVTDQTVCRICSDQARGVHYGVVTCEGCKGFFKRVTSMSNPPNYRCYFGRNCPLTPETRNNCKACRLQRCIDLGMMQKLSKKTKAALLESESSRKSPSELTQDILTSDDAEKRLASLHGDPEITAALRASGFDDLDALKSTPSGLALIRKVLSGNTKSSPDALKSVIRGHLQHLPRPNSDSNVSTQNSKNSDSKSDREDVSITLSDDSGSPRHGTPCSTTSDDVPSAKSTSPKHCEAIMPPMPPLILGVDMTALPPLPPLLHVPLDSAGQKFTTPELLSVNYSNLMQMHGNVHDYMKRNLHHLHNGYHHPYNGLHQQTNSDMPLKKRKRGRPRKIRPVTDEWYTDICDQVPCNRFLPSPSLLNAVYCPTNSAFKYV